jgi:hypothetical protein
MGLPNYTKQSDKKILSTDLTQAMESGALMLAEVIGQ